MPPRIMAIPTKISRSGQKMSVSNGTNCLTRKRRPITMMNRPTRTPPQCDGIPKHISSSRRVLPASKCIIDFPHCVQVTASSGFLVPQLTQ